MSTRTIYKFTLDVIAGEVERTEGLPLGSKTLCAQEQWGKLQIWVELDREAWERGERVPHTWYAIGTGHDFNPSPNGPNTYVGTVQIHGGRLVLHVYEQKGLGA